MGYQRKLLGVTGILMWLDFLVTLVAIAD